MDVREVSCELLTKENACLMDAALAGLNESDELSVDPARLRDFLACSHNLAFIAKYQGQVCGFAYGYSLMSLTAAPQLFVYSVDVLRPFQNNGIGSKMFQYMVDYSKENGYSECFVITDKANKRACRVYEKAGGKNDFEDEIVYVIKHS